MKINYFDLGLHKDAAEIDMFIRICEDNNIRYSVWGFEAHPDYCSKLGEKYCDDDNVIIINKAISNKNGKLKLYLADTNEGEGNSIFSTKNNVNVENFIEVEGILFSDWIKENVGDFINSNNIIRFNIEGAEWYLINDLNDNKLLKYFKIFLGSSPDIIKVGEIKNNLEKYNSILKDNNIKIYRFTKINPQNNCDLNNLLKNKF